MIKLTDHQLEIADKVIESLQNNIAVGLNGSAGTGKTTTMKYIISKLGKYNLTATTHQASKQLADKTGKNVKTIHSFLGLKMQRDYKGGYVLVKDKMANRTPSNRTVAIDESSMIGKDLYTYIKADYLKNKYLFVYDEKQLPPVGEVKSQVFNYDSFTLKEIHRQKDGNDNINLSLNLDLLSNYEDGTHYFWINRFDVFNRMKEGAIFLSWTNATVINTNNYFRETVLGYTKEFVEGEKVILQGDYGKFKNSEIVTIYSLTQRKIKGFNFWLINNKIAVPTKEDLPSIKKYLSILLKNRDFESYYNFLEMFVEVKHAYASTIHKSQGSTYDNCIVNITECIKNR